MATRPRRPPVAPGQDPFEPLPAGAGGAAPPDPATTGGSLGDLGTTPFTPLGGGPPAGGGGANLERPFEPAAGADFAGTGPVPQPTDWAGVQPPAPTTPTAPTTPAPNAYYTPSTWQGNINQQTAVDWINNYARNRQGKDATPEQLAGITQYAQSQGWQPGTDLRPEDWNRLVDWMDTQKDFGGNLPGQKPPETPVGPPTGPVEPVGPDWASSPVEPPVETPVGPTEPIERNPIDELTKPPVESDTDRALKDRLKELLGTSVGDVDPNSPAMNAQRNAFLRAQQRGLERGRNAMAERAASEGTLGAGGFDADIDQLYAGATGEEADFEAGLIGREIEGQRARLQQAMGLAAQVGDAEKARDIQMKLGALDADLRRQGLDIQRQGTQGGLDMQRLQLALQEKLGLGGQELQRAGLDLQRLLGLGGQDLQKQGLDLQRLLGMKDLDLRRLLGIGQLGLGQEQLKQQGSQFGQQMGFNYWKALQDLQNTELGNLIAGLG